MKFTLYTSFYNYLDTADDLCTSIINQTYTNWEWIITDDFSDNPEVIQKLKQLQLRDKRIKLIETKWKKQYYYNFPIEHSTGEIIVKLDSDDTLSPKLLEVYKYNYEKFPEVISIGTSSIIKKNTHKGFTSGAKYINYGKTSNYIEANDNQVYSVIGDARSYKINLLKNNGIFVNEFDVKFKRGEDVYRAIVTEEWGKFFAIPRILYNYTMRDDSISGGITVHENKVGNDEISENNFLDLSINNRKNFKNTEQLISIEKYYDSSFDHLKNFYFSGIENEIKHSKIEYWSDNLFIEDKVKINEIYFDHKIEYNTQIDNPNYIVINTINNMDIIDKVVFNRKLSNCTITLTTLKEDFDKVYEKLKSLGYEFWFNIFYYGTFKINL